MGNREIPLTFDDFNHDQGSFFDSGTTLFYAHSKVHKLVQLNLKKYVDILIIIISVNEKN